jgi:hypothetical protein
MPSERTFVTELATGLGMCGLGDVETTLARRPSEMANLTIPEWDRLTALRTTGKYDPDFDASFQNGLAFLEAPDGLNGRRPRIIEWTGGRRAPGDEVVPADLRVDHVYFVSCKYLSKILHNPSPARLVEGLLSQAPVANLDDWYARVAPVEYQALFEACMPDFAGSGLPARAADLLSAQRQIVRSALRSGWPAAADVAYASLCTAVSKATADAWSSRLTARNSELVLWRLLRIGATPYFILGASRRGSIRLRIDTPWDWRESYRLLALTVEPLVGGQPLVGWSAHYMAKSSGRSFTIGGHVEVRWSHGRFGQPPEAKVYLDSPHEAVPGYHEL